MPINCSSDLGRGMQILRAQSPASLAKKSELPVELDTLLQKSKVEKQLRKIS